MEPAELQKQLQPLSYEQKVNEMQKMLPRLEQSIANAIVEKENEEELHKLKLLQRVLCGQAAAGDVSLTLEELDKYAALLEKGLAPTAEIQTSTAADDKCDAANVEAKENVDASNAKSQYNLKATANVDKLSRNLRGSETEFDEFRLSDSKQYESFEKRNDSIINETSGNRDLLDKGESSYVKASNSQTNTTEKESATISESPVKINDNFENRIKNFVEDNKRFEKECYVNEIETPVKRDEITEKECQSFGSSSLRNNSKSEQSIEMLTKERETLENGNKMSITNGANALEASEEDKQAKKENENATIESSETKSEGSCIAKESESSSSENKSDRSNFEKESEISSTKKEIESSIKASGICGTQADSCEKSTETFDNAVASSGKQNENTSERSKTDTANVLCVERATQANSSEINANASTLDSRKSENVDEIVREQPVLAKELPSDAEDPEEVEYEEVELIKIPEGTAEDEMILPDSADEDQYDARSSHGEVGENGDVEENNKSVTDEAEESISKRYTRSENESNEQEEGTLDTISTKNMEDSEGPIDNYKTDTENEESNNTTTDSIDKHSPLHVEFSIQMDNQIEMSTEFEETTHTHDPLSQVYSILDNEIEAINKKVDEASAGCSENTQETTRSGSCVNDASKSKTDQLDDDDDVEIIETRNSPICLDTDDEDEKMFTDKTLVQSKTVSVTLKNSVMKTQGNHTQNRTTRIIPSEIVKSVNSITETINLLDSSDEEVQNSKKPLQTSRRGRRSAVPTVTRTLVRMPNAAVGKKRTLLPVTQGARPTNPKQGPTGGALSPSCRALLSNRHTATAASASTKKVLSLFKPTPQSNFLNAVNLLPANSTPGDNPLAFSAKLLDKNIIIPNAFYANRRTSAEQSTSSSILVEKPTTPPTQQNLLSQQTVSRVYREWLNEFINNFADPQQIASHTCLVLLQSALKYKAFARIKELRIALNTKAYSSNCTIDPQLARELNNTFYLGDCRLSDEALRFCSDACTQIGKIVTLMSDAHTGRITMRTNTYDELLNKYGIGNGNGGGFGFDDKRKRNKKDEEYTPAKYYEKKVEESTVSQGERRKSLRQHRTRCYDETYLYEQEETEEEKPASVEPKAGTSKRRQDSQMLALVQRKAEEKRLEAKRQRQQQVKSFESAYLAMFANTLRSKNVKATVTATNNDTSPTTSANAHIIIDDDDEDSIEDGEPRSHRIYKVVPTRLLAAQKRSTPTTDSPKAIEENRPKARRGRPRKQELRSGKPGGNSNECELITCDSTSGESTTIDDELLFAPDQTIPKNTNANYHALNDRCRICNKNVPRIVLHYVSTHPDTEVYSSRLPRATLARLRNQGGQILQLRPYMNGQEQYAADCIFCNKQCCFKIPYWYQHYSMHTGEYAYRCSGCHIRKATRSSMIAHINQPCRKRGKLLEDYVYRTRTNLIEMRICTLCNYMQLHRRNILKHLRTQHGLVENIAKYVETIILLRMPQSQILDAPVRAELVDLDENSSNQAAMTFNYDNFEDAVQPGMWDAGDPTDDLSYMICGMLDVQLGNTEQ